MYCGADVGAYALAEGAGALVYAIPYGLDTFIPSCAICKPDCWKKSESMGRIPVDREGAEIGAPVYAAETLGGAATYLCESPASEVAGSEVA